MRYKTLLFDVDDTILDFRDTEHNALKTLFAEQDVPFTEVVKQNYQELNHQLWQEYENGKMSRAQVTNERFGLFFQQLGKTVDSILLEKRYRHFLNQGHKLLGNSREIVADLSKKAELYIVTNGVSETQYQRLNDAKLMPYFKEVFVSEDTGYQKPMKEFFDYVFERIPNLNKEETVIIGDSLTSDILGGNLAGIDTIWLNPEKKAAANIQPTHQITALDDIYPILSLEAF